MTDYHKDIYSDTEEYILDNDGDKIPSCMCLCYAHGPSECMCGAWDRPVETEAINKYWELKRRRRKECK